MLCSSSPDVFLGFTSYRGIHKPRGQLEGGGGGGLKMTTLLYEYYLVKFPQKFSKNCPRGLWMTP